MSEEKKMLTGAFCSLEKFSGEGWGIQIEEDGDIYPGLEVKIRKKDGSMKKVTIRDVIYHDHWKVVCTFDGDPDDKPQDARKGAVKRSGAPMGEEPEEPAEEFAEEPAEGEDPRPRRQGAVSGHWDGDGPIRGAMYDEDPRPRRKGTVAFGRECIDLGGVRIAKGLVDISDLYDLD